MNMEKIIESVRIYTNYKATTAYHIMEGLTKEEINKRHDIQQMESKMGKYSLPVRLHAMAASNVNLIIDDPDKFSIYLAYVFYDKGTKKKR